MCSNTVLIPILKSLWLNKEGRAKVLELIIVKQHVFYFPS